MAPLNDRIKEFSQTGTGRIVVVAVPGLILAAIIAVIALTMLGGGEAPEVETAARTGAADTARATTETAGDEAAETPADTPAAEATTETVEATGYINKNYEVYETRDPFEPVDASSTISGIPLPAGSSSSSNTPAPAGVTPQILALKGIEEDADGVLYANVTYGSSPYLVKAGQRVGSSSYQVTSIDRESATFLFGDDNLVLRVGESAGK
jgi:hypothetical protein